MAFKKMTDEERAKSIAEIEAHFARQAERANAPAIRLEEGEMVAGTIEQISVRTSDYGTYPVLVLKRNDNSELVTLHAFHQIIQDRLKELKPQKGDMLFVSYAGKRQKNNPTEDEIAKGRDTYHLYNLETDASLLASQGVDKPYEW